MLGNRHEKAHLQSDFYRNQYRKFLRFTIVSIFIMFALIGAVIYLILFEPSQPYYASTTEGKIISLSENVVH